MKCNYLKPWCNTITSLLDWQKLESRDTRCGRAGHVGLGELLETLPVPRVPPRKAECRRGGQPSNFTLWTHPRNTLTHVYQETCSCHHSSVNNLIQPKRPPVSQRRGTKAACGMLASKDAASSRAPWPGADVSHYCGPLTRTGTRRGAGTEGQTHTCRTWAVTCKRLFIKLYKKAQEVRSLEGGVTSWIIWKS